MKTFILFTIIIYILFGFVSCPSVIESIAQCKITKPANHVVKNGATSPAVNPDVDLVDLGEHPIG